MTSQPKTTSGPSENAAGNTADTAGGDTPLDRSSAEWRSQFGVLPSAYQQSGAARPSLVRGRGAVPPVPPSEETQKRSPGAFIVGAIAVFGVAGLIAYGYLPSQRAGNPNKGGKIPTEAVIASGSSVKNTRGKIAPTPSPSPSARPAAVVTKTSPVKVTAKSVPVPRPTIAASRAVRAAAVIAPKAAKPEPTPQPRRERPQPQVVRSAPAPVVVVATPRSEPKAAAKPVAKPAPRPAPPQQLPKASRPNSDVESDGINPLGLPQ